jgi:NADH-quinone oxidoreductase subunit J
MSEKSLFAVLLRSPWWISFLLVAIIAAIALTLRTRKDSKYQDPSEQVRVKAADRMELLKIEPVRPAPPKTQEQP